MPPLRQYSPFTPGTVFLRSEPQNKSGGRLVNSPDFRGRSGIISEALRR